MHNVEGIETDALIRLLREDPELLNKKYNYNRDSTANKKRLLGIPDIIEFMKFSTASRIKAVIIPSDIPIYNEILAYYNKVVLSKTNRGKRKHTSITKEENKGISEIYGIGPNIIKITNIDLGDDVLSSKFSKTDIFKYKNSGKVAVVTCDDGKTFIAILKNSIEYIKDEILNTDFDMLTTVMYKREIPEWYTILNESFLSNI